MSRSLTRATPAQDNSFLNAHACMEAGYKRTPCVIKKQGDKFLEEVTVAPNFVDYNRSLQDWQARNIKVTRNHSPERESMPTRTAMQLVTESNCSHQNGKETGTTISTIIPDCCFRDNFPTIYWTWHSRCKHGGKETRGIMYSLSPREVVNNGA